MDAQIIGPLLYWIVIITIIPFTYFLLFIQRENWQHTSVARKWIFHISLIGSTVILSLLMLFDYKLIKWLLKESLLVNVAFCALISALSTSVVLEILSSGISKISKWMRTVYPLPYFVLWPFIMAFQTTIMLLMKNKTN